MDGILPDLRWSDKERLLKELRRCAEVQRKIRLLIITNLAQGRSVPVTAIVLHVHRATVYRVAQRFREQGLNGLGDGRCQNGPRKVTDAYLTKLQEAVGTSPADYGWRRPTWTRELLVAAMFTKTRIQIHVGTMSRALQCLRARRGRPKPVVRCPWSESRKKRCLAVLRRLAERLPPDEVLVYEDEIDIHLNPKIGSDWMLRGQQKPLPTPGRNQKWYLAGALNPRTKVLTWVEAERKNSSLFVQLLWKLACQYPRARKIHVILDNYGIHNASLVQLSLNTPKGRKIQLHFLPPYCPDDNRIERLWEDLHAEVTRNHHCPTIHQLMKNVRQYLNQRNRDSTRSPATRDRHTVAESRTVI